MLLLYTFLLYFISVVQFPFVYVYNGKYEKTETKQKS